MSNKQPSITESSKHIQGIVDDIYHSWGRPWYIKLIMYIGFIIMQSFLPEIVGRTIWNFGCSLNYKYKSKKVTLEEASFAAYLIIFTASYYQQIGGIPECDKKFLDKYDKFINPPE